MTGGFARCIPAASRNTSVWWTPTPSWLCELHPGRGRGAGVQVHGRDMGAKALLVTEIDKENRKKDIDALDGY
ncbi:MAG: hypothetical protein ACUVQV_06045 [Dissulfurimicrobium sp.]|uniref:hypothetical protein n=1 Tax=Dissulfurimicrobium sp. TaxID=2022436 RepID=UPI00404A1082